MKKIIFFAVLFMASNCFARDYIQIVKQSYFEGYVTVEKVMEEYFTNVNWEFKKLDNGTIVVVSEGNISKKLHDTFFNWFLKNANGLLYSKLHFLRFRYSEEYKEKHGEDIYSYGPSPECFVTHYMENFQWVAGSKTTMYFLVEGTSVLIADIENDTTEIFPMKKLLGELVFETK